MDKEQNLEDKYKTLNIGGVSDSLIEHIKRQIAHHKEQEDIKAKYRDYKEALYHNHRLGALEDLMFWVKLNNR